MSCGVVWRHGLDLAWLWLWRRSATAALIWPLAWEPPYAAGVALKRQKGRKLNFVLQLEEILLELVASWYHVHLLQIPRNLDEYKILVSRKGICFESFPHFIYYGTRQANKEFSGVPLGLSRLRILCCQCCGLGRCCDRGLILWSLGQEFPHATGVPPLQKKKKTVSKFLSPLVRKPKDSSKF